MNNILYIRKISELNNINLSDAEIRVISFRLNKVINKKITNQVGGSIKKCLSVKNLLDLGNNDLIKHILNRLLNNQLNEIEFICHKYTK